MKIYEVKPPTPKIKAVIFGKPGAGKTLLASTAQKHPEMKDVLFLNVEGGLLTVANTGVKGVDIGINEDGSSSGHIIEDLEKVIIAIAAKRPGFEKFNTIVVDSASEIQTKSLEEIAASNTKHSKDERHFNDFGKDTATLKRVFRMLKDLKVNVIFTAIEKVTTNEAGTKVTEVAPALTPKVGEALMGYVDFVWYLFEEPSDKQGEKSKRKLLTKPKGPFRAKTRHPKFSETIGETVVDPDLSVLYDILCKVLKNESQ